MTSRTAAPRARKLVDQCIARIADPAGEGQRVFIHVDKDAAIEAAEAMDRLRKAKAAPSRFAGIPVSIKDLFDIKGQVTRAGSRALDDSPPAQADATVVARLRRAGFVVIGRTNMTEFAYSGIGINPHYGTPKSAWQRSVGHVPGGSSSGAAVSIADRMAYGALGTDTGGSCRIPAAFNGIVGFKPTQRRVPLDGGVPLSSTLDSFGPLARSVSCCAILDAVLADEPVVPLRPRPIKGMKLAVPTTIVLDDLDDAVAKTFERALETLSRQGASIERIEVPEFLDIGVMNTKGGFSAAESYAWHRFLIASKGDVYDPRVSVRILRGEGMSAADYVDLLGARRSMIARIETRIAPYDALVHADHGQHAAAHRRSRFRRQGVHHAEPARVAQSLADQHDRRLLDLAAGAARGRSAGRTDAGGRRRIGSPHLRARGGNGGGDPCLT